MKDQILYDPYPHQQAIHDSKASRKFVMQPVRSGKDIALVNDNTKDILEKLDMYSNRPDTMTPRANYWFVAETYKLLEQLYRDVLAYTPKELIVGNPSPKLSKQSPEIQLIYGIIFSFRSALNEAYLVAEGLDRLNITEAGELPRTAWELLQSRLASPDRFQTATAFVDGTPRGQVDPLDPTKDHWFWAEVCAARGGNSETDSESWYWFEDRKKYGNIEHPIHSLSPEGQALLDSKRNDPNLSERKFREDFLGECLPVVIGDPVITNFNREFHIRPIEFMPRYKLYRTWDFGRNYPVVIFHQITKDNTWLVHQEIVGIKADMLDTELADLVIETTNKYFRNTDGSPLPEAQVVDYGDFEATHKEDSRRESTIEILKLKGISLGVQPTKFGDEQLAIDHLDGRMKVRDNGKASMLIHPRCEKSIRCFDGAWVYKTATIKGYEHRTNYIAEIQPWIDIFDAFKYFIIHKISPDELEQVRYSERKKRPRTEVKTDADGAPIGYKETV